MAPWAKIKNAPYYLEKREGKYRTSYRVNYRAHGLDLRQNLDGEIRSLKDAIAAADKIIAEARFGERSETKKQLTRCEDLCDELVQLKLSKAPATHKQTELFFRVHINPYLNGHCPYAADLNATVWLNYKNAKRIENPHVSLFNHWKFFVMLFKYAHQKGILPSPVRLEFNEEREDNRARGLVIPDADFWKMVQAATPKSFGKLERIQPRWRDRILMQRFTGMRPGEVRELRKDRWSPSDQTIRLRKEDTKTRQAREFVVDSPEVLEILDRRLRLVPGPFFFPSEADPERSMDKHLSGWQGVLKRAGVNGEYTPHDLRHSYLTQTFKMAMNPALICFQAGLSLEEAQKTYLHFTAKDTAALARTISETLRQAGAP